MWNRIITGVAALVLAGCQLTNEPPVPKQAYEGFYMSSLSVPPVGWKIMEIQGFSCQIFSYSGEGDYMRSFNGALERLREDAQSQNFNGFINVRVTSDSYEVQGSKWHSSAIHICGDAVRIE